MRSKALARDYRYFPDPDLLPLVVEEKWVDDIRASMPELPDSRKARFISQYHLPAYDAELLSSRKDVAEYFETALKSHANAKAISNWIVGDLFRVLKERKLDDELYIRSWPLQARQIGELVRLIDEG